MTTNSYIRNSSWVLFGTVTGGLLAFGTSVILARMYSPAEFGTIQLVIAVGSLLAQLATLGITNSATYFVAVNTDNSKSLRHFISLPLIFTSVLVFTVTILILIFPNVLISPFFSESVERSLIFVPTLAIAISSAYHMVLSAFLRGLERFAFLQLWDSIIKRVLYILPAFLVSAAVYIWSLSIIEILLMLGMLIFLGIILRSQGEDGPLSWIPREKEKYMSFLAYMLPLALSSIAVLSQGELNTLILALFGSEEEVGFFKIGIGLSSKIGIVLGIANAAFLPEASRLVSQKQTEALSSLYAKIQRLLWISLIPVACLFIVNADAIIRLFYGDEYLVSVKVLIIGTIGASMRVAFGPTNNLILAYGKTRVKLVIDVFSFIVVLALNVIAIPKWGSAGAALAWSSGLIIWNLLLYGYLRFKMALKKPFDTFHLTYAVIIITTTLLSLWVASSILQLSGPMKLIFSAIMVLVLVIGLLLKSGLFDPEREMINSYFSSRE